MKNTNKKQWLKDHGHKAADVDKLPANPTAADLCQIHGVSAQTYEKAKGKK